MREKLSTKSLITTLFVLTSFLLNAQESVKLTFFKSGVLEYRTTESFGAKMPEKSIIGLMVNLKEGVPTCGADLGAAFNGKIVLIPSNNCDIVQTAQAAERAGAIAVIVIDNVGTPPTQQTPILKVPCLRVDVGTGTFYQQQCAKPTLVCLSGSMYSGKVVSNESPKVADLSLDDHTRMRVTHADPKNATTPSIDELMANIRPIAQPEVDVDPNAQPAPDPISTPSIADAIPVYAAVDANPISNYADFTPRGGSSTPSIAVSQSVSTPNLTESAVQPKTETPPSIVAAPVVSTPNLTESTAQPKTETPPSIVAAPVVSTPNLTESTAQPKTETPPSTIAASPNLSADQAESQRLHDAIEVYPKRVSEFLSVTYNFEERTSAQVKINDATGKTVLEKSITNALSDFMEFDVLNLAVGNYKIVVQTNNERATFDISVQH